MGMLKNLGKAALAALATPVGLAADIVTLPAKSYNNEPVFGNMESLIKKTKTAFNEAVKPEKDNG